MVTFTKTDKKKAEEFCNVLQAFVDGFPILYEDSNIKNKWNYLQDPQLLFNDKMSFKVIYNNMSLTILKEEFGYDLNCLPEYIEKQTVEERDKMIIDSRLSKINDTKEWANVLPTREIKNNIQHIKLFFDGIPLEYLNPERIRVNDNHEREALGLWKPVTDKLVIMDSAYLHQFGECITLFRVDKSPKKEWTKV